MEMEKTVRNTNWSLFRLIIPVFPEVNIFSKFTKSMTALGPVLVATAANKLWGWRVEIIDENNYKGPRDSQGLPDHKKLQKENSARVVGFYCGLTCTMERVWELAEFYRQENVVTMAGGWHAHYCPAETLSKNIDIVVHGDGEIGIQQLLRVLKEGASIKDIPGISFLGNGRIKKNPPEFFETPDLNDLPYPDFGLLKYAEIKIFPIGRIRGCRMNCEFCSVKGKPRWASSQYLFNLVNGLVETKGARSFFITDDRLEEDLEGTVEFFRKIAKKYRRQLNFTVQVRLEAAKNSEFLEAMKKAGVRTVCIGYESPIEEELKAMRKGYLTSDMLKWTRIYQSYGFRIHAMFIFGYPLKEGNFIGVKEATERFRRFIRQAHFNTVQVLHPVPLVGTDLYQRLEREGRIFPRELVSWAKYDGSYVCFKPNNMSLREFQEIPMKLMKKFYNPFSLIRIFLRTFVFPIDYLTIGWESWHRGWQGDVIKYGGHLLIQRWQKGQKKADFLKKLEQHQAKLKSP